MGLQTTCLKHLPCTGGVRVTEAAGASADWGHAQGFGPHGWGCGSAAGAPHRPHGRRLWYGPLLQCTHESMHWPLLQCVHESTRCCSAHMRVNACLGGRGGEWGMRCPWGP